MSVIPFPQAGDCAPYFFRYIDQAAGHDPLVRLAATRTEWLRLADRLPEAVLSQQYAPGKWTVREVIGHIIDTEHIFGYRLLRIARGDTTSLPGFDQDVFAAGQPYSHLDGPALMTQMGALRTFTLGLLHTLPEGIWHREGTSDGKPLKALAIPYILVGHEIHHLTILKQAYGLDLFSL